MFVTSLKNQEEFELVNKRGKKLHGKYFILVIAKNFSNILHNYQNSRVLSKLAYREEFKGDTERRTAAYSNVREDSSTGSTYKLPLEVEFGKNSTIFLGIKVSKKLDKRAVIRNKIKRRIKHLTRLIINNPKFKITNLGMIMIPRKGFDKVDFSILTHELNKLIFQNL